MKQIVCAITSRLAHRHKHTSHTATSKTPQHNNTYDVTPVIETNNYPRQPQPLQYQRRHRRTSQYHNTATILSLLFGINLTIRRNSLHQLNISPYNNTPHMKGHSILTTIFNNNKPNIDANTTTSQQTLSPSLLSDTTTDDIYAAETQQINNSSSHKPTTNTSPSTTDDANPNSLNRIIAETEHTSHHSEYSDYVPPSLENMPTNVQVQIRDPGSPESYTNRVKTSVETSNDNTSNANNNVQPTITTKQANSDPRHFTDGNNTKTSSPQRPPPGIPSMLNTKLEQHPPENHRTTSTAPHQQPKTPSQSTCHNNNLTPMDTSNHTAKATTNNANTIDSTILNQLMNHITNLTAQVQHMNKKIASTPEETKLNTTSTTRDTPTPTNNMTTQPSNHTHQQQSQKQPTSALNHLHVNPTKQSYAQKLQQSTNTHRSNTFDHISPNSVATDMHSFMNKNDYSVPHRPIHNSPVPAFSLRWHSTIKTLKTNRYFDAHFSSELPANSFVHHFNSIFNDPLTEIYLVHHEDCPTRTSNGDVKLSGYIDVALLSLQSYHEQQMDLPLGIMNTCLKRLYHYCSARLNTTLPSDDQQNWFMPNININPTPLNGIDAKTTPSIIGFFKGITNKQISHSFLSRETFLQQYLHELVTNDDDAYQEFVPFFTEPYLTSTCIGLIPYRHNNNNRKQDKHHSKKNNKQPNKNTNPNKDDQTIALVCADDQYSREFAQHVIFMGTNNPVTVFGGLTVVLESVPNETTKRNNIIKTQLEDASKFNINHTSITIGPINPHSLPTIQHISESITSHFSDIKAVIPTILKSNSTTPTYGIQILCRKSNTTTIRQSDPHGFQSLIFGHAPELAPTGHNDSQPTNTKSSANKNTFTWDNLGTNDYPRWIAIVWGKGGRRAVSILHWNQARKLVHGVSGAVYKGFKTHAEALNYIIQHYPFIRTEQDIVEKIHKTVGLHSTNLSADLPESLLTDTRISRRQGQRIEYPYTLDDSPDVFLARLEYTPTQYDHSYFSMNDDVLHLIDSTLWKAAQSRRRTRFGLSPISPPPLDNDEYSLPQHSFSNEDFDNDTMTNSDELDNSQPPPFTYIHDTKIHPKFNTTGQPITTTLSDNQQQLLDEYTNTVTDDSHTTSSLTTSSSNNPAPHKKLRQTTMPDERNMPEDSNYPSFKTGVALPVPSFTTYYDANLFIQQVFPNMLDLMHSIKLGCFDDGSKMDHALLLFTHNERCTDTVLQTLDNIQPRKFLNSNFHLRNINQGLDSPAYHCFYKANEHEEYMAQTFIVQQAKVNCDPSTPSIEKLRSIITSSTNEQQFFKDYITHIQSHTPIGRDNTDANLHSKTD